MASIVSLIGLPSSGKSTIVNALVGKRILKTGISRTTLIPTVVGKDMIDAMDGDNEKEFYCYDLVSDDGYPFTIIDLPGFDNDDGDDYENDFYGVCMENVLASDIVLWTSPGLSAFISKNECDQFRRVIKRLRKESVKRNKVYQIGLILTKVEDNMEYQQNNSDSDEICGDEDEIIGDEEGSTIRDTMDRISKLDFMKNVLVFYFNSYGRIIHRSSSEGLKKMVRKKISSPSPYNIEFNLASFAGQMTSMIDRLNKNNFHEWYARLIKTYSSVRKYSKTKFPDTTEYNFDLNKLFCDNNGEWSAELFEKFMRFIYMTDDMLDSYRVAICDDTDHLTSKTKGIMLANTYICCEYRDILSKYIKRCDVGLYKYRNLLNLSENYIEYLSLHADPGFLINIMRLTESDSDRFKHMVATLFAMRNDETDSAFNYYDEKGRLNSYNYVDDHKSWELDQLLDNNRYCGLDLDLHDRIRTERKRLYVDERLDISQLIRMKIDGELDSVFENVLLGEKKDENIIDQTEIRSESNTMADVVSSEINEIENDTSESEDMIVIDDDHYSQDDDDNCSPPKVIVENYKNVLNDIMRINNSQKSSVISKY